jgi:hypothetical protein
VGRTVRVAVVPAKIQKHNIRNISRKIYRVIQFPNEKINKEGPNKLKKVEKREGKQQRNK